MSDNFGSGVSRVLNAAFHQVIWQEDKPPLDSELNLVGQVQSHALQQVVARTPSGWLGNETNTSASFVTNPTWSNWFQFGRQRTGEKAAVEWAVVNGWLVPVTGTKTGTPPGSPNNTDTYNRVLLDPPPSNSGESRADFVFLEVWKARVPSSPSTLNKPSASGIYQYGNVEGGYSHLTDDLIDPEIGAETTQRVQIQYRIRVQKGIVGLSSYPEGFDPSVVKAQGAATTPTSFVFSNMRTELGDPGLWRAGDGTQNSLGTVDGYVYAIPISVVFRRNTVAWAGDPSQNLNGAFDRNPTATDRTGAKTFSTVPTVLGAVTASATSLSLASSLNIPLPATPASPVLIQIGDELLTYTSVVGTTLTGLTRGVNGTVAEPHASGSTIKVISGRPDGLFADQVAKTDILDARHVVSLSGFDYQSMLQSNFDRLLKGELRANWKRSGGNTQGIFIPYQDKVSASAAGLGVTKLDAPDGIRMTFSDAAVQQPVEVLCTPFSGTVVPPATQPVGSAWSLSINAVCTRQRASNQWDSELSDNDGLGDRIRIPVAQFKTGVSGGDADQVRMLNEVVVEGTAGVSTGNPTITETGKDFTKVAPGDTLVVFEGAAKGSYQVVSSTASSVTVDRDVPADATLSYVIRLGQGSIQIRIDGGQVLPQHRFKVTPSNPTPSDDLLIEFAGAGTPFPIARTIYITTRVMYGAGRGLSRRPSSLHSVTVVNPNADLLVQPSGTPATQFPLRTSWMALSTRFRGGMFKGQLPVTGEAFADLGSRTVSLTPYRRIAFPSTPVGIRTIDGSSSNRFTSATTSGTAGSSADTTTFTDLSANFSGAGVAAGHLLVIPSGLAAGTYRVSTVGTTTLTVDRAVITDSNIEYSVYGAQGMMPLLKRDGSTPKWTTTDPLQLFSGTTDPDVNRKNVGVTLPRHLVPGWGSVFAPVLPTNGATFHRGVNFLLQSREGLNTGVTDGDHCKTYINYTSNSPLSYATLSTGNFSGPTTVPATYNSTFSFGGVTYAGARIFTDQRGMGRKGIELPPFYGIARLWAVYESADFKSNGSSVNPATREPTGGGATNLLRQNFSGPVYWIEIDDDGDSTFVINAEALDLTRSPSPISTFESKSYVVEASLFGFDRGSFDLNQPFKLVLSRDRTAANTGTRSTNLDVAVFGPVGVLPGPLTASDTALVTYSRTPYQGDPWGSTTTYTDTTYQPGPITSALAYQVTSSPLNGSALTRPNQKPLEVLASLTFATTLGSGRLSGDVVPPNVYDPRNIGYEDVTDYPPVSGAAARPDMLVGALSSTGPAPDSEVNPEYLGCTDALPLGALYRDKDFKGQRFTQVPGLLQYGNQESVGTGSSSLAQTRSLEQTEVPLMPATLATGAPSDVLVHVDGEVGNYALLTNFRTNRGGSLFAGSGDRPGGDVYAAYAATLPDPQGLRVLTGKAFLVRNTVTSVGLTEVSAGDEIMMLIMTTVLESGADPVNLFTMIGTSGTGEGLSAADLYRVDGHPLVSDHVRSEVDPATIKLSASVPIGGV